MRPNVTLILTFISFSYCQKICKKKALVSKSFIETYYYTYYKTHETSCYMGMLKCFEKQYHQDLSWRLAKRNVWKEVETCCPGYEKDNIRSTELGLFCAPTCEDKCINGVCIAPNECKCFKGYNFVSHSVCEHACSNCEPEKCLDSNNCECAPGYHLIDETCKPICENCFNGECIRPNECRCPFGYTRNETGFCVKNRTMCEDGYIFEAGLCVPFCEMCRNGVCTAPYQCDCNPGYMKTLNGCEPFCESGCPRGQCVAPDVCECSLGYESKENTCIPICEHCEQGECIEPNVCRCNSGFMKTDAGICVPKCLVQCPPHAFCIAPTTCKCETGYEFNGGRCFPVCDGCVNGICTAPGVCECVNGFTLSEKGGCLPKCKYCKGGFCMPDGFCRCPLGYKQDIYSNPNCVPLNTGLEEIQVDLKTRKVEFPEMLKTPIINIDNIINNNFETNKINQTNNEVKFKTKKKVILNKSTDQEKIEIKENELLERIEKTETATDCIDCDGDNGHAHFTIDENGNKEDLFVFVAPMVLIVGLALIVVTLYVIKSSVKHSDGFADSAVRVLRSYHLQKS